MEESNGNKRYVPRYRGKVRCLDVTQALMPLVDISVRGLSFKGEGFAKGDVVNLWLVSEDAIDHSIETLCEIVSVADDRVAAVFLKPSEQRENFIIAHIEGPLSQ